MNMYFKRWRSTLLMEELAVNLHTSSWSDNHEQRTEPQNEFGGKYH